MLKSIDVLVGLVVIMLALSMAVTVITQFVTTLFNSRGRHLKRGLADLLAQVDARLKGATGTAVVQALLTHPLVSGTSSRLGSVFLCTRASVNRSLSVPHPCNGPRLA